jgi:hypothetical protein
MNMIDRIKSLQFIFKPNYWIMNEPFNKDWDDKLNLLMDKFEPVFGNVNELDGEIHTISFGGINVWVSNYPYAYATPDYYSNIRPSRLTIQRLYRMINQEKVTRQRENGGVTKFMAQIDKVLND